MDNINFEEFQKLRIKNRFSIELTEKVLYEFSNIHLIENKTKNCETNCFDKFSVQYNSNKDNKYYNFDELLNNISSCSENCEEFYRKITDHQKKGAEISYFTFQKQLTKCKDLHMNEPDKLLNCYNYKISKVFKRFGTYYFNQRINLVQRFNN